MYYRFANMLELEKYDDADNCVEKYDYVNTCTINGKMGVEAAKKRVSYLERGYKVLDQKSHVMWDNAVRSSVYGENSWINAGIIEATLLIMEDLSQGATVEEAYKHIDLENEKPIYNSLLLNGSAAWKASAFVASLHARGEEFEAYHNKMLKNSLITDKTAKKKV